MKFLLLISLLIPPLYGQYVNSPSPHWSDYLKLKCDALPYRTVFTGNRCYFAVSQEVKLSEASALCASIFPGSDVASDIPGKIFSAMMLEKSKFHVGKDSSGKKFQSSGMKGSICFYESGFKCDVGEQSAAIPGKCVDVNDQKRDLDKAIMYCKRQGMVLPSVGNELENRMIRDAIQTNPVWIQNSYAYPERQLKWYREKYYSKYSTCSRPNVLYAGREIACNIGQSSVIDKTGYWGNAWEKWQFANACVKDAENAFTPGKKPCIPLHEWDEETGRCEWTGAKDACVQVIDYVNRTFFVPLKNFPKETQTEFNFVGHFLNDLVWKAIVRRGCMFTGFASGLTHVGREEEIMTGNLNRGYGEVNVPCYYTGDLRVDGDGLSRLSCYCDPTEANVNDYEYTPPAKKKCIEHHVFNEDTQTCEWKHDPKFCAEIITYDGRRQMLEIENWPASRKYDVNHWYNETKRAEDFHLKVTDVIVRQHCWATMYWRGYLYDRMTLKPTGYGKHQVASHYNGLLGRVEEGTHRVVCECLH